MKSLLILVSDHRKQIKQACGEEYSSCETVAEAEEPLSCVSLACTGSNFQWKETGEERKYKQNGDSNPLDAFMIHIVSRILLNLGTLNKFPRRTTSSDKDNVMEKSMTMGQRKTSVLFGK